MIGWFLRCLKVYENDVQERRLGSHVDVANLKDLFEQLRYADLQKFRSIHLFLSNLKMGRFASLSLCDIWTCFIMQSLFF